MRDRQGRIAACRENVALIEPFASEADLDALLARRGWDDDAFAAAVAALPAAAAVLAAPTAPSPPKPDDGQGKATDEARTQALSPELAADPAKKPAKQKSGGTVVSRGKSYPVEVVRQV